MASKIFLTSMLMCIATLIIMEIVGDWKDAKYQILIVTIFILSGVTGFISALIVIWTQT